MPICCEIVDLDVVVSSNTKGVVVIVSSAYNLTYTLVYT